MPTARIITRFPERAASLRKTLIKAGYHVEVVPPGCASGSADLEYDLEQMPEYASDAAPHDTEPRVQREFVFAPQWRALKARFGKPEKKQMDEAPSQTTPASLNRMFVDSKTQQPSLGERLAVRLRTAKESFREKRIAFEQQRAAKRAQSAEQRRIREANLVAKREAQRLAAERASAEAALHLQEQKEREAKRLAEIQAQMELRRQAEERARHEVQERARVEAERRALEAERIRRETAVPVAPVTSDATDAHAVATRQGWSNHEIRRRFGRLQQKAKAAIQDWRSVERSDRFRDTRQYARRQAVPAAAGIALAFVLGWATATGGSRMRANDQPMTSVVPTSTVSAPVEKRAVTKARKPSAARAVKANQRAKANKPNHTVQRRNQEDEDAFDDEPEVIVRHHYPGKATVAKNNKGVKKTISDLE